MAWDFSTEPAVQAELDWMAAFVREEIWPLETLDLGQAQLDRALRPLQEQVKSALQAAGNLNWNTATDRDSAHERLLNVDAF